MIAESCELDQLMESPEEKCIRYLQGQNVKITTPNMNAELSTSTPNSENVDLAMTLFKKLFSKDKKDEAKNDNLVNGDGYESSSSDELLNKLVCRTKLFPDESSAESDYDDDLETFINNCLLDQDFEGMEDRLSNYLREKKETVSLVNSLRVVRTVMQPKIRRKLRKIVMKHFKADKKTVKACTSLESSQSLTDTQTTKTNMEQTEEDFTAEPNDNSNIHQDASNKRGTPATIDYDESITFSSFENLLRYQQTGKMQSPANSAYLDSTNKPQNGRRSERIHSHPPGYFKVKPRATIYYSFTPESPKKRKSFSSPHKGDKKKKKKAKKSELVEPTCPSKENLIPNQDNGEFVKTSPPGTEIFDQNQDNEPKLTNRQYLDCLCDDELKPVERVAEPAKFISIPKECQKSEPVEYLFSVSDIEEDAVDQPTMCVSSVEDDENQPLAAQCPLFNENASEPLLTSNSQSNEEHSALGLIGHIKKRLSKKTLKKSLHQSLPDLSPLTNDENCQMSEPVKYLCSLGDNAEKAVDQPKMRVTSVEDDENQTRAEKIPVVNENVSEPLLTSNNQSNEEHSALALKGHIKKRLSKKSSKKRLLHSLPDLTPLTNNENDESQTLAAKFPLSNEIASEPLLNSNNQSNVEHSALALKGHIKQRLSKKTSKKRLRQSLPDLSRLPNNEAENRNRRRSERLSSHAPDFFKRKIPIQYIYVPWANKKVAALFNNQQ